MTALWHSLSSGARREDYSSEEGSSCANMQSRSPRRKSPPPDVPKGSLAVYVGEENKRFVIPIRYLSHPVFVALLKKTEEEFGFCHNGAMHLPCDVAVFYRVLKRIEGEAPVRIKLPRGPIGLTVL